MCRCLLFEKVDCGFVGPLTLTRKSKQRPPWVGLRTCNIIKIKTSINPGCTHSYCIGLSPTMVHRLTYINMLLMGVGH